MAESVSFASGIVTLSSLAYSTSEKVYGNLKAWKEAPRHVQRLSNDLEDIYLVLGSLQDILEDEKVAAGLREHSVITTLERSLESCMEIFKAIGVLLATYRSDGPGLNVSKLRAIKWSFKESDVAKMQQEFQACKATINLALNVANL